MDRADASPERGLDGVEAYEVEDGVVLFDARNPLAWIEGSRSVRLTEMT